MNHNQEKMIRMNPLQQSMRLIRYSKQFYSSSRGIMTATGSAPSTMNGHSSISSTNASRQASTSSQRDPLFRVVTKSTMNKAVMEAQYAVRGAIPLRAEELRDELHSGKSHLPFEKIVSCNIGNPQQLDQKPLTFLRQVSRFSS